MDIITGIQRGPSLSLLGYISLASHATFHVETNAWRWGRMYAFCRCPNRVLDVTTKIVVVGVVGWWWLFALIRGFAGGGGRPVIARLFFILSFFFSFSFFNGNQIACTNSTLLARISPQRFRELKWLWTTVFGRAASEIVSLIGAHTMSGQHSQPQCMRVYVYISLTRIHIITVVGKITVHFNAESF